MRGSAAAAFLRFLIPLAAAGAVALAAPPVSAAADAASPPPVTASAAPATATAEPLRLAFVGLHGGVFEVLERDAADLPVRVEYIDDAAIDGRRADLSRYRAVFIQHGRADDRDAWRALIAAGRARRPDLQVFGLSAYSGEGIRAADGTPLVAQDPDFQRYYGASKKNLRSLLVCALRKLAGRTDLALDPPESAIRFGLYHPDHEGLFEDVPAFLAWARATGRRVDGVPRVAVVVHGLHLELQQPKVIEALVRRCEKEGLLAAGLTDTAEGMGSMRERYEATLAAFAPGAVIHTCHAVDREPFREALGAPHLHSVFFKRKSIAQWQESETGVDGGDWTFQVVSQEVLGAIEPHAAAGTLSGGGGAEAYVPIEERVERLVARAAAWARLGTKKSAAKKVAFIYYDREMGKSELMRGSATGMFMNAPRSLVKVLARMKEAGYAIDPLPRDDRELLSWLEARGRIVGRWAPGELDRLVREGAPALVPVEKYRAWLEKHVPEAARRALIARWGEPPGRFMVWANEGGEKFIVIPRIDLGGAVLLPQPLRGEAEEALALLHDKRVPPPHNYLATYFWLEEELHADVMVHFGTHGSELALPGKFQGLSGADWTDIAIGTIPNVNPWVINNLGESSPVKRRAMAVTVSHMVPAIAGAGLSDDLANLHDDIDKWTALEPGALKEKFRAGISQAVRATGLDRDLKLDLAGGRLLAPKEIEAVEERLHDIGNETTPLGLHVLGEPPADDLLVPYVVTCLRQRFLDALGEVVAI
ncbi:MAG TPA: cobaltochelatase subunit CobN, partial [Planctomycetota bacterium]|nr:cobaltochelatase subunit CobN [Planctomycetota bacterium]